MSKKLKALKELTKIQCSNGNWNYDPYMHGMANGMILAVAIIENKNPDYLSAPKKWLIDKKIFRHFVEVSIPTVKKKS